MKKKKPSKKQKQSRSGGVTWTKGTHSVTITCAGAGGGGGGGQKVPAAKPTWTGKDGTKTRVSDMTETHILNCLGMLKRRRTAIAGWEDVLTEELLSRAEDAALSRGMALSDDDLGIYPPGMDNYGSLQ